MLAPKIAVAALNPHGGEGGLLGREEIEEIGPAIIESRDEGYDVTGPIPSDSVFYRTIDGEFDVVLALYHERLRHRQADRRAPRNRSGGSVATAQGLRIDTEKHRHLKPNAAGGCGA